MAVRHRTKERIKQPACPHLMGSRCEFSCCLWRVADSAPLGKSEHIRQIHTGKKTLKLPGPGLSQGTRNKWGVQACALPHSSGTSLLLKAYSMGLQMNPALPTTAEIHHACDLHHAMRPPHDAQHADRSKPRPQWRDQRHNHPKP